MQDELGIDWENLDWGDIGKRQDYFERVIAHELKPGLRAKAAFDILRKDGNTDVITRGDIHNALEQAAYEFNEDEFHKRIVKLSKLVFGAEVDDL